MTMQSDHREVGVFQSVAGQMALLMVALIAVMALAWFYVF